MPKTIHFLSGLPRSGNTLLSALLNQNPDFYSSPISPLSENIYSLYRNYNYEAVQRNEENYVRHTKALQNYSQSFYADVKQDIIFDREKDWATPPNLFLIKEFITDKPKVIFTVRNLLEVLASMITINRELYLMEMRNFELGAKYYLTENDALCEYLMRPMALVDKSLLAMANAMSEDNSETFHIVQYKDLVKNPEQSMKDIYKFLDLSYYPHNFANIKKVENDNDAAVGLSPDTHHVRKSITPSEIDPHSFFSPYILDKYSNIDFARKADR